MPRLVIIFITYERTDYAIHAINETMSKLHNSGGVSWYVCDDGSRNNNHGRIMDYLKQNKQHICGHHTEKLGYGGGVNKAWRIASQTSPVTLWLEDDWRLSEDWDVTPYVDQLIHDETVGMLRFGYIQVGMRGAVINHNHDVFLDLDKNIPFAFAGHPHLKHDRFMTRYGDYPTGVNPGQTEIKYDEIVRRKNGPRILWHIGCHWGKFAHFGAVPAYE